jgi:beta-galactosidase
VEVASGKEQWSAATLRPKIARLLDAYLRPLRARQVKKDSLEFYITTRSKQKVQIALPENWENNWHFVAATYNGSSIFIDIDGRVSDKKAVSGNIRNTPFPVNIGRNAEIHGQETVSLYL